MAKQITILKYTGRLGNKIGFKRNGKYYERSMPESVRQTTATRRAAHRFGWASSTGAVIRKAFNTEIAVRDSRYINRLTSTLIPNKVENLKGFRFNQSMGTERFFTAAPKLSGNGILHIPQQILPVIKGITALEVKVIGIRIDFATQQVTGKEVTLISLTPGESFAGAALPLNVPGTGILLVSLQVSSLRVDGFKKHLAADIIEVQAPKTAALINKPAYHRPPAGLPLPVTYTRTLLIQRE